MIIWSVRILRRWPHLYNRSDHFKGRMFMPKMVSFPLIKDVDMTLGGANVSRFLVWDRFQMLLEVELGNRWFCHVNNLGLSDCALPSYVTVPRHWYSETTLLQVLVPLLLYAHYVRESCDETVRQPSSRAVPGSLLAIIQQTSIRSHPTMSDQLQVLR
jgi:hypothetical protein